MDNLNKLKNFSVFVLDDDEMFCFLLTCLAARDSFIYGIKGYKLSLTFSSNMKNLDVSIDYIKNNRPNLILLDYFLGPHGCMASLEVLEKLITCCLNGTEIILITGMDARDVRYLLAEKSIKYMNMDIVQKPFTIDGLKNMIEKSIKRQENVKHN